MIKHTPGPWRPSCGMFVHAANNEFVAVAKGNDDETVEANARLIAAAPDMLAALQDAYDLLADPDADQFDAHRVEQHLLAVLSKVRAA